MPHYYKISKTVLKLIFILYLCIADMHEISYDNIGKKKKINVYGTAEGFITAYNEIVAELKLEQYEQEIESNDNVQFLLPCYECLDFNNIQNILENLIEKENFDIYFNYKKFLMKAELKECYYKINIEMLAAFYIKVLEHIDIIFKNHKQDYTVYHKYLASMWSKESDIKMIQNYGLFSIFWHLCSYLNYKEAFIEPTLNNSNKQRYEYYKISKPVLSLVFILLFDIAFESDENVKKNKRDIKDIKILFKELEIELIKAYNEILVKFDFEQLVEPNNVQFLFSCYEDKDFDIEKFILEYKKGRFTGLHFQNFMNKTESENAYYKINLEMLAAFYIKVLEYFNLIFNNDNKNYTYYQIYIISMFLNEEIKNIQNYGLLIFAWHEYNYFDFYNYIEKEKDLGDWNFFWKCLQKDIIKYKKGLILYYSLWYIIFFVIPWPF